jgi:hypothetical protein
MEKYEPQEPLMTVITETVYRIDATPGVLLPKDNPTETPQSSHTEALTDQTSESGALYPDTVLDKATFLGQWRSWMEGNPAQSESVAIANLPISDEDWHVLATYTDGYRPVFPDLSPQYLTTDFLKDQYNLTVQQYTVIQKIYRAFLEVVRQDGRRNGLGEHSEPSVLESDISIGVYDHTSDDNIEWHVDSHRKPTVRYVLAYGEGMATQFAHGSLDSGDLSSFYYDLLEDPATTGRWQIMQPPQAVVTRFPSRFGVHSSPPRSGFRLFMTASLFPEGED